MKNNSKRENFKLSVDVINLNVNGVRTHYKDKIWVEDENHPDGGYYHQVSKLYKTPRSIIDFFGKVNIKLVIGGIYSDGINDFIAVSENEIKNCYSDLEKFEIPKYLTGISQSYCEK